MGGPVPPPASTDSDEPIRWSPRALDVFLERLERVGFEEEQQQQQQQQDGQGSAPTMLESLLKRLDELLGDDEGVGSAREDGTSASTDSGFSFALQNRTQLTLPEGPTLELLKSLRDLVSRGGRACVLACVRACVHVYACCLLQMTFSVKKASVLVQ